MRTRQHVSGAGTAKEVSADMIDRPGLARRQFAVRGDHLAECPRHRRARLRRAASKLRFWSAAAGMVVEEDKQLRALPGVSSYAHFVIREAAHPARHLH